MIVCRFFVVLFAAIVNVQSIAQERWEVSGKAGFDVRYFLQDALYQQQHRTQLSAYLAPELYKAWNNGNDSLLFSPFYRLDQHDRERSHFDIRELLWLHVGDDWELRTGIGKVFWGQTESLHLVDVINQTDLVEAPDGEDKLGQPMVNLQLVRDWGTTSFLVLPYFRERTFPGLEGRLRSGWRIDTDNPLYESDDQEKHIDWAVRWQHSIGDWELGLSYFDGTARDPLFLPQMDQQHKEMTLRPFYQQMQQTGLDVLAIVDAWILKLEAIYRHTAQDSYFAAVGGFEYTQIGVFNSSYDIGWLMEYQYDDRGKQAMSQAQNDLMLGSRIVFNNVQGSEVLLGLVQDLDYSSSRSGFIEASSRINDNWKWNFNAWFFSSDNTRDMTYMVRRDDFVEFSVEYYF